MTIQSAIQCVIDKSGQPYAVAYAQRALLDNMQGDELRTQCLYIRTNLQSWRGPMAQEVKIALDSASHLASSGDKYDEEV